jgi:hypothetical protein
MGDPEENDMTDDLTHLEEGLSNLQIENYDTLRRKLMYDLFPHTMLTEGFAALGIVPGSDEVVDLEHMASHVRDAKMSSTLHQVTLFIGAIAGEVLASAQLMGSDAKGLPAEKKQQYRYEIAQVVQVASVAVVAELLDLGVIAQMGQ